MQLGAAIRGPDLGSQEAPACDLTTADARARAHRPMAPSLRVRVAAEAGPGFRLRRETHGELGDRDERVTGGKRSGAADRTQRGRRDRYGRLEPPPRRSV